MAYPVIMNGDHAEFEAEWDGKDQKERTDWPLPSFDALDWAEAFCKVFPETDQDTVQTWFANALMRGYDHRALRINQLEWALEQIADPFGALQKLADIQGHRLDTDVALLLSKDISYLQGIARAALLDET